VAIENPAPNDESKNLNPLVDQAAAGFAQVDLAGRFVYVNQQFCELVGRSREELLTFRMQDITHPEDLPNNVSHFRHLTETGEGFVLEKRYLRPDGSTVWSSNSVFAIRDGDGRPIAIAAVCQDITARRLKLEDTRRREAFLKLITDGLPACLSYVDRDERYVYANATYGEWFGVDVSTLPGESVQNLLGEDVYESRRDYLRRALAGERLTFNAMTRVASGRLVETEVMYVPDTSDGEVRGILVLLQDISERRRFQDEQRRSEARLHVALRNKQISVFNQDRDLRYTWIYNPRFGYLNEEVAGKTDYELFGPESGAALEAVKREAMVTRASVRREVSTGLGRDVRHYDLVVEPLIGNEGEVEGVTCAAVDITEERESRERLRVLADLSQRIRFDRDPEELIYGVAELVGSRFGYGRVVFADVDLDAERIWVHRQYTCDLESIEGRFPLAAFGRDVVEANVAGEVVVVSDAKSDPRTLEVYDVVYANLGIRGFTSIPLLRNDRVVGVFTCHTAEPHEWTEDEVQLQRTVAERAWAAVENLRLNAELERRVEERTAELQAKNQELEGFTYSVSHDMRTPLRGIVGNARMLMEDYGEALPEEARRHLSRVSTAAQKMANLVDDLLQFARLGVAEPEREPTDVSALARRVADNLGEAPQFIEVERGLHADVDRQMLGMAIFNLLENACKYRAPDRSPQVRFGFDPQQGAYFVSDNGIGFDMQYIHKLFKPFERLHRDEQYPGTGIGLANVRRVIERHGGRIWAEAAPGEGATFWFTLPPAAPDHS